MKLFEKFYIYFIFEDEISLEKKAKNMADFLAEYVPRRFEIEKKYFEMSRFEGRRGETKPRLGGEFSVSLDYRFKTSHKAIFSDEMKPDYDPLLEVVIEYRPVDQWRTSQRKAIYINLVNEATGEIIQRSIK